MDDHARPDKGEPKHTPGPWSWDDDGNGNKWGRRFLNPAVIHSTVEGMINVDDEDARLIAAAPDLLDALLGTTAALTAAISLLEKGGKKAAPSDKMFAQMLIDYGRAADQARTAIVKVKGRA